MKCIIQIVLQVNQRPFRGFIHQIMRRISAGHLHGLCREVKRLALLQKHSTQQHLNTNAAGVNKPGRLTEQLW